MASVTHLKETRMVVSQLLAEGGTKEARATVARLARSLRKDAKKADGEGNADLARYYESEADRIDTEMRRTDPEPEDRVPNAGTLHIRELVHRKALSEVQAEAALEIRDGYAGPLSANPGLKALDLSGVTCIYSTRAARGPTTAPPLGKAVSESPAFKTWKRKAGVLRGSDGDGPTREAVVKAIILGGETITDLAKRLGKRKAVIGRRLREALDEYARLAWPKSTPPKAKVRDRERRLREAGVDDDRERT